LLAGEVAAKRGGPWISDRRISLVRPARRTDSMTGKRTRYSAEFKARVALDALRGELTTAQLAAKHGIHQTMVSEWKRQAMDGLASVFSGKAASQESAKSAEAEVEKLHAKIGQLLVERDFLAKASGR
jgi:transposase